MQGHFSLSSFGAGIALGAILAAAWFLGGMHLGTAPSNATPPSLAAGTSTGDTLPAGTPSGAIEVPDQPSGPSVTIDSVTVPPPGVWIAVREVNGGDLGNVLGAARVGGPRTALTVSLLRATEPDTTYAVELYRDNGDSVFDLSTDSVYVDFDSGTRVIDYFKTTQ